MCRNMTSKFNYFTLAFLIALLWAPIVAVAQEVEVTSQTAGLYDSPKGDKVGVVPRGKKVMAESVEDGYYKLKTKSGKGLYIKESDVKLVGEGVAADDVVDADEDEPNSGKSNSHLTYDIGASTGSYGGTSYTEAQVGLNWFFKDWIAWRNAVFSRFITPENIYGLDTSLRLFYFLGNRKTGVTVFGGPGFRFVTKGDNSPFAEAGLVAHLGGINVGGGVKTFFTSAVKSGAPTDTQYFIILSGGGSL